MAVTNNQIILTECALRGITEIVHTYAKWQELGYQVQKGQKALFTACIYKCVTKEDKEGLMYIKNNQWKNKRHSGILKVKKFMNADCEIIGYEEGTGRLEGKLGAFVIDYKGNKVNVGSGYTDDERIEFWQHRDYYIGRILQVKFKEESKDKKTGLVSIQFPIYQCIREIGKEVSYNG